MPHREYELVLEIKDPIHGYIELNSLEQSILDLRLTQKLRNIRSPAGVHLVYPGADVSLLGSMLGVKQMTGILFDYLEASHAEVLNARLTSMLLSIASGPWANVMEEYLTTRGIDRRKLAKIMINETQLKDVVNDGGQTPAKLIDLISNGAIAKDIRIDLLTCPINPRLIDCIERDAYFAGVEYAQLEFRRLFTETRLAKNKIAVKRSALFTLESYLSASVNMFEAVYYHKTVRAAELMLLRVLEVAGSQLFDLPDKSPDEFFLLDDLSFMDRLIRTTDDETEEMKDAHKIYTDFRNRYLIKRASTRMVSNKDFLDDLRTPDGLYKFETEIAEEVGIDPSNVYVDYPDRASVRHYPGKYPHDDLVLFERGASGYEFWTVDSLSLLARSLSRPLRTVRVYTTRGYRSRVKKVADNILESVDSE